MTSDVSLEDFTVPDVVCFATDAGFLDAGAAAGFAAGWVTGFDAVDFFGAAGAAGVAWVANAAPGIASIAATAAAFMIVRMFELPPHRMIPLPSFEPMYLRPA